MILVDTSVWIDHLRHGDETLADLLLDGRVLTHPFVIGELAMGDVQPRAAILADLSRLPRAETATDDEVLRFVERYSPFGRGVGYIDVHLLAAVRLTADATLWTKDKRLKAVTGELDLAMTRGPSPQG